MLGLMLQVAFTGKPMGFLRVNSPGCLLLFFRAIFIHTIPIASLFFLPETRYAFVLFQEQR